MNLEHFENLVVEAIESIPEPLFRYMENVEILVEEWPTPTQRRSVDLADGNLLLGLYEGIPLTERTSHCGLVLPDKITIFRRPILMVAPPNDEAIRSQIRRTVLHEIAHHFGISDERLVELGAY